MNSKSGLRNRDVIEALTSMREMYGLNVVLSIRLYLEQTQRVYLRVEWFPVTTWPPMAYGSAEIRFGNFADFAIRDGEDWSPAMCYRCLMMAEPTIEAYFKAALAAGLPPRA